MKKVLFVLFLSFLTTEAKNVTCEQFNSWKEAQAYFDAKKPGYKGMDRDHDGEVCEGMSHKDKNQVEHIIQIYKDRKKDSLGSTYASIEQCEEGIKKLKNTIKNKHLTYKCIKLTDI